MTRSVSPARVVVCALAMVALIPAVVVAVMGTSWRLGLGGLVAYIVSIFLASWYAGCALVAEARIARTDGVRNYLPPAAAVWVSAASWLVGSAVAAWHVSHPVLLAVMCGVPMFLAGLALLLRTGQPTADPSRR